MKQSILTLPVLLAVSCISVKSGGVDAIKGGKDMVLSSLDPGQSEHISFLFGLLQLGDSSVDKAASKGELTSVRYSDREDVVLLPIFFGLGLDERPVGLVGYHRTHVLGTRGFRGPDKKD